MFKFWGDGSELAKQLVQSIRVRSTENFNWTFIFILAVVFYVYWTEIHKKITKQFLLVWPFMEFTGSTKLQTQSLVILQVIRSGL